MKETKNVGRKRETRTNVPRAEIVTVKPIPFVPPYPIINDIDFFCIYVASNGPTTAKELRTALIAWRGEERNTWCHSETFTCGHRRNRDRDNFVVTRLNARTSPTVTLSEQGTRRVLEALAKIGRATPDDIARATAKRAWTAVWYQLDCSGEDIISRTPCRAAGSPVTFYGTGFPNVICARVNATTRAGATKRLIDLLGTRATCILQSARAGLTDGHFYLATLSSRLATVEDIAKFVDGQLRRKHPPIERQCGAIIEGSPMGCSHCSSTWGRTTFTCYEPEPLERRLLHIHEFDPGTDRPLTVKF